MKITFNNEGWDTPIGHARIMATRCRVGLALARAFDCSADQIRQARYKRRCWNRRLLHLTQRKKGL